MGEEPPPGGGTTSPPSKTQHINPDQRTATAPWAASSVPGGISTNITTRSFEQILEDEKKNRNIIEIKLVRNEVLNQEGILGKARNLDRNVGQVTMWLR